MSDGAVFMSWEEFWRRMGETLPSDPPDHAAPSGSPVLSDDESRAIICDVFGCPEDLADDVAEWAIRDAGRAA